MAIPLVSVLITAYNAEPWLAETLEHTKSAQHVFVFCHHPRWTEGNYGDDWRRVHALLVAAGNVTCIGRDGELPQDREPRVLRQRGKTEEGLTLFHISIFIEL